MLVDQARRAVHTKVLFVDCDLDAPIELFSQILTVSVNLDYSTSIETEFAAIGSELWIADYLVMPHGPPPIDSGRPTDQPTNIFTENTS